MHWKETWMNEWDHHNSKVRPDKKYYLYLFFYYYFGISLFCIYIKQSASYFFSHQHIAQYINNDAYKTSSYLQLIIYLYIT